MSASLLALLLLVAAPAESHLATAARPALLRPMMDRGALCSANPQLTVVLSAFTPPRGRHATLVVSLRTGDGRTTELGHVGVYPERAFSASTAQPMRFGFAVPRGALALDPIVVVAMTVDGGPAPDARAVIAEARIGLAPQEHC